MKKLLLLSLLIYGTISCVDLDIEPDDFSTTTNYYNTEEELNAALTGVYDALGERFLYSGINKSLVSSFNCTDEMYLSTKNTTTGPSVYNYAATDDYSNNIWAALYKGVERSNILLDNIHRTMMDAEAKKVIEGEARFLRAYFHFVLVQNYGAVPIRVTPAASVDDVHNKRIPADSVYKFIYNEMVEAEKMVLPITNYDYAERVTKSAVQGILARVCLFMAGYPNYMEGMYEKALYWAEKVIDSDLHELNQDYSQVFINLIQSKYDTKENIWEVGFYTSGKGEIYSEKGYLGNTMGIFQRETSLGYSANIVRVQQKLFDKYNEWDLRRDWCIAPYAYENNTLNRIYKKDTDIYSRFIGKYRREYELITEKSDYDGTNFPLLRYSDILLMAAEAENELHGPTGKAVGYVNEVRRRAHASGKSIKEIVVNEGGSGYVAANTTITISGGDPVNIAGLDPISAVATVSGGKIAAITLAQHGTIYTSTPVVNIKCTKRNEATGEEEILGSGATATVVMSALEDFDLTGEDVLDYNSLKQVIMDERARELCFEGNRRLDLMRWGILVSTMKELATYITETAPDNVKYAAIAGNNIQEKHNYLPIPEGREIALNHQMEQTELWK